MRNQVHYQRRAGRDYPEFGVEQGMSYYWWTAMVEGVKYKLCSPQRPTAEEMETIKERIANGKTD